MKYFEIFPLLLVVCLISASNLQGQRNATYPRIIGGKEAIEDRFPYMVGLEFMRTGGGNFCGGALIDHEWVLTAAHCTIGAQSVKVYLGMLIRGRPLVEYDLPNTNIVAHENFNHTVHTHDIAVVKIHHVDYSDSIDEILLPPNSFFTPSYANLKVITMGWGATSRRRNRRASTLQYITLKCITNRDCSRTYDSTQIYNGKVCTDDTMGHGPCDGDSGGPLVAKEKRRLIGIYSFGVVNDCASRDPVAYTRVYRYLKWIHDKTGIPI